MAHVVEILIASSPSEPAQPVCSARALPGRGLEGDRYANGKGTFSFHPQKPDGELTLVEQEQIERFVTGTGISFSTREARRNVVTLGVDLNALVGREFKIGEVLIRGIRLCEPCSYLAKQTSPEVLKGLVHRGGLRAQILTEGLIQVGDTLIEMMPQ